MRNKCETCKFYKKINDICHTGDCNKYKIKVVAMKDACDEHEK